MSENIVVLPNRNVNVQEERQKPRLLSLVFCDFASFTKDDKTNLLGIFDRVYVHPEIKQSPRFTLFIRTAETPEPPLTVTIFNPSGDAELAFIYGEKFEFTAGLPVHVQLVIPLSFRAESEGTYWFDVSYKEESLGGAGLVVEYRKSEDKAGGTDTYI